MNSTSRNKSFLSRLGSLTYTTQVINRTRVYSFANGLTLDYVYELTDNTLTISGGFKG